jgi:hypothetical protein
MSCHTYYSGPWRDGLPALEAARAVLGRAYPYAAARFEEGVGGQVWTFDTDPLGYDAQGEWRGVDEEAAEAAVDLDAAGQATLPPGAWLTVDLAAPVGPAVAVAVHTATRRSWWGLATSARCRLSGETWTVVALSSGQLIGAATTAGAGETVSALTDPVTLAALATELGASL